MSTHTIHAALTRSTGPALGTIALSALILTSVRVLTLILIFLNRLPVYIPARAFFLVTGIRMVVGYLEGVTTALSKYALVYAGLTGDPFMSSARRAQALTNGVEAKTGRNARRGFGTEPPLLLLTIAPLTLTFPFALTTYLFVAHTLNAPDSALSAALLAGGVTAIVGLFCVGLVQDAADTLWICYCIDKDMGQVRREEVLSTFEYNPQSRPQTSRRQPVPSTSTQTQPMKARVRPKSPPPPQPQYLPSATTSRYIPRQPLLPPSPSSHSHDQEEDPDPFEQSHNPALMQTALPSAPTTSGPRAVSPPQLQKMKTSTELNMKSFTRPRSPLDGSVEEEAVGGSQFFPGSGIF
ncbi:hypothetical protein C0992_011769 [Termitomyces sp. T32_za158]|nr:hypothetical protein C0992_011769 [Termitomyces sp. T32_za158]